MGNLDYLGIHEYEINRAIERAEHAMKHEGFDDEKINDMHAIVFEDLKETGNWEDITNSIIHSYFNVTTDIINEKHDNPQYATYYVNGLDSHFYLDREEVY